jgi:hypothetical protein
MEALSVANHHPIRLLCSRAGRPFRDDTPIRPAGPASAVHPPRRFTD